MGNFQSVLTRHTSHHCECSKCMRNICPSSTLLILVGDEMWTSGDFGDVCYVCGHEKCWCGCCAEVQDDVEVTELVRTKSNKLKKKSMVLAAF
jgi:hypothetical protein